MNVFKDEGPIAEGMEEEVIHIGQASNGRHAIGEEMGLDDFFLHSSRQKSLQALHDYTNYRYKKLKMNSKAPIGPL